MTLSVVKIGGSLAREPAKLRELCKKISQIAQNQRLIIIPGGGDFADAVRKADERFSLSISVTHQMAILGMDQYGLMLGDLTPNSIVVRDYDETKQSLDSDKLPIFLPSRLMIDVNLLESSWDVTSDSIALYLASSFHASKVVLVKDVDGIFTDDPKKHPDAKLLVNLQASELLGMKKCTSVDIFFPKLLLRNPVECFIVNGLFPERVEAVLSGQKTVCTLIK